MIARLRDDKGILATLGDDLRWTAENSAIEDMLNTLLDICERSPGVGDWVHAHVARMAEVFEATAEHLRPVDAIPGRIY